MLITFFCFARFGVYFWISLLGGLHCRSHKQNGGILVSPIQLSPHLLTSPFRRHLNRGIKHLNEPLSCELSV
ncbi:hypothetical protein Hanom_Chr06g00498121 [Helianthus anomalus]